MTTPFWCLFVAGLLPYVWVTIAAGERRKQFGKADNKLPRLQEQQLTGRGARAMGAHNNAFETFPFFAAAVVVAHLANADPAWSADFAIAYVVLRIAHGFLYLADIDVARSLAFGLGQVCSIALFVLAMRA
ncbi:MAG TPA: MAPEG family protein [Myxococcota bacterium]|nr:MAPEG family protein [Myxococcota bacterium]